MEKLGGESNWQDCSPETQPELFEAAHNGYLAELELASINKSRHPEQYANEVAALRSQINDGNAAAWEIALAHLKLARKPARAALSQFDRNGAFNYDDAYSASVEGIFLAAKRYDYQLGYSFSTLASLYAYRHAQKTLKTIATTIRLPIRQRENIGQIYRFKWDYYSENSWYPSDAEVSEALGLSEDEINQLKKDEVLTHQIESLDEVNDKVKVDWVEWEEQFEPNVQQLDNAKISDPIDEQPLKKIAQEHVAEWLFDTNLDVRAKLIVALRFGLAKSQPEKLVSFAHEHDLLDWLMEKGVLGRGEMTLEEVGKLFGVTRERIRQIENRSLHSLRHPMEKQKLIDTDTYLAPQEMVTWKTDENGEPVPQAHKYLIEKTIKLLPF